MNTASWSSSTHPAAGWSEVLLPEGFTPAAGGYERAGLRVCPAQDWWTLEYRPDDESLTSQAGDARPDRIGQAGAWKWVAQDRAFRLLLALPASLFTVETDEICWDAGTPVTAADALLRWAHETAAGVSLTGWTAPLRKVVESWFSREQLTVVAGPLLRQGEVIREPGRLALRFPILSQVPGDLPPARLAWLRALLEEAQDRSHLVRCGFLPAPDGAGQVAIAEVDLTGVPPVASEILFVTALEALRGAVQWLGEPADWLADPNVASELLAVCPQ
jgi:hypothetical protein